MQNFKLGRLQKYLEIMPDLSNSLRDLTIKHPVYQLVACQILTASIAKNPPIIPSELLQYIKELL